MNMMNSVPMTDINQNFCETSSVFNINCFNSPKDFYDNSSMNLNFDYNDNDNVTVLNFPNIPFKTNTELDLHSNFL